MTLTSCSQSAGELPGKGTWRVINYWAIWCKPCRDEIPELNELDRSGAVTVLGVNFDHKQGDELRQHIAELAIEFDVLPTDPAQELGYPRPTVLPTTVIIDPAGAIHHTAVGPQRAEDLRALMGLID
jgi:thiol-disulfide isomerase/thioredoxin